MAIKCLLNIQNIISYGNNRAAGLKIKELYYEHIRKKSYLRSMQCYNWVWILTKIRRVFVGSGGGLALS